MISRSRTLALAAVLALAGSAPTAVAAPAAEPANPATTPSTAKSEPLPVTPVPVPALVIVQTPGPPPAAPPIVQPSINEEEQQALALLADLQRYASDPPDDVRRELAAANTALARTRTDANRIRLAMLLTLPAAGAPDDARALTLLEPLVSKTNTNTSSPLKQIATLLYAQIGERARIVREEQRRTAAAQEKLDALRAVERSLLLERSRNAGGGSAGGGGGTGR